MTEFEKELVRFVSGYLDAGVSAEDYVKAFSQRLLDSIGRQSKPKVSEDVSEDVEEEILNSYDESLHERWTKCPYTIFQDIARHFYELGRKSKGVEWTEKDIENGSYISAFLQANCGNNVILKEATMWFMSRLRQLPIQQSKVQPVSEGLEEEIDKRWREWLSDDKEQVEGVLPKSEFAFYARHFAQWGAEHRGGSEIPKDLESYAQKVEDYYDVGEERGYLCVQRGEVKDAVIAGASWQKEKMLKEAVEGEVVTTNKYTSVRYLSRYGTFRYFYGIGRGYKKGDKVRIVIIKEERLWQEES